MNRYRIVCRVSGGVTGTRQGYLKHGPDHAEVIFDTLEEAEAEAARLRDSVSPYSTASFRYYPEKY